MSCGVEGFRLIEVGRKRAFCSGQDVPEIVCEDIMREHR